MNDKEIIVQILVQDTEWSQQDSFAGKIKLSLFGVKSSL